MRQMSIRNATPVDVGVSRAAPTVVLDPPPHIRAVMNKDEDPMQSVAAYYVLVATELANQAIPRRYQVEVSRPNPVARFLSAVLGLVRSSQPAVTQPGTNQSA